ncbi:hypothetical protein L6164_022045 [Bauhinia variegata]|uniref:Uncharacterized protein n=1 Tax=Bauhinia variegata TaxID=167791 RepID=A0ACB9MH99_BAUVA|nr:hypothetical protein L6164_022045 [Bauhinia variegata]
MSETSEQQHGQNLEKTEGSKGDGKVELQVIRVEDDDEEECKTPTRPCNQIASTVKCPPAPRKRRAPLLSLSYKKRSFTGNVQLKFFEDAGIQEVDSFFQSLSRVNKRCRSI